MIKTESVTRDLFPTRFMESRSLIVRLLNEDLSVMVLSLQETARL